MTTAHACANCGADLNQGDRFCAACGHQVGGVVAPSTPPARGEISTARVLLSALAGCLIVLVSVIKCTSPSSASAVQITQVMAEGIFALVAILGLLLTFYVASRRD